MRSKTQASSPFKGGEPAVHHERAARALERLGILCYNVAKPMKECGCQETVFTNSQVGTKIGGRPGFGKQLLTHAEEQALMCGMSKVRLEVRQYNLSAINFYSHLGYRIDGNASDDSFYMSKNL